MKPNCDFCWYGESCGEEGSVCRKRLINKNGGCEEYKGILLWILLFYGIVISGYCLFCQ